MTTQTPATSPLVFNQKERDTWARFEDSFNTEFNNKTIDMTERSSVDFDLPFEQDLDKNENMKLTKLTRGDV